MQLKLDLKDRRILNELDKNARQSNSELAKKVGLKKNIVNYRTKQLEKKQVIKGYNTIIDSSKLGYYFFRIYIKLQSIDPEKEKQFKENLMNNPEITWVGTLTGQWNIVLGFHTLSMRKFRKEWADILNKSRTIIQEYNISILVDYIHYRKAYLINEEKDTTEISWNISSSSEKEAFDNIDLKIIKLLLTNARIPIIKIAQKLNMSATAIVYRIKKLEKKQIIQGYRADINYELLGYEYYKTDIQLNDLSIIPQLEEFAKTNPNIVYVDKTIGGSDFEFDVEVKNLKQYLKIINTLIKKFSDKIRSYNYFRFLRYDKITYLPI